MNNKFISREDWDKYLKSLRSQDEFKKQFMNEWVESWWMQYNKILILAHTEYQARNFANEQEIPRQHYNFLHNYEQLMGHTNILVIFLDNWDIGKSSRDLDDILHRLDLLKAMKRAEIKYGKDFQKEQSGKDISG